MQAVLAQVHSVCSTDRRSLTLQQTIHVIACRLAERDQAGLQRHDGPLAEHDGVLGQCPEVPGDARSDADLNPFAKPLSDGLSLGRSLILGALVRHQHRGGWAAFLALVATPKVGLRTGSFAIREPRLSSSRASTKARTHR